MTLPGQCAPDPPIVTYLKDLPRHKRTLPHGQPVCVSATSNVTTTPALLRLATAMGPYIAVLQVQSDNINDWSTLSAQRLIHLAEKFGFLLWEGGRLLNTQGRSGQTGGLSEEDIAATIEIARKRYTKGSVSIASWAALTTTWSISSEEHHASARRLLPELRHAAKENAASATMSVRTEITAGNAAPHSPNGDVQEVVTVEETTDYDDTDSDESIPGPLEDDSDMALNLRKFSAISLTQTITQHEEASTESSAGEPKVEFTGQKYDAGSEETTSVATKIPSPPPFSRGVLLCLPTEDEARAYPAYRTAAVDDTLGYGDFALGFLTAEPWGELCHREKIQAITWSETYGQHREVAKSATERARREDDASWTPGSTKCFVIFAPLANDCVSHAGGGDRKGHVPDRPPAQPLSISPDHSRSSGEQKQPSSSGAYAHQISALHDLVGRAAAVRDASFPTKGIISRKEGADILYVPIISMEA